MTARRDRVVLALEGSDGSGKSSLAVFIKKFCDERSISCELLGRVESKSDLPTEKISELLRWNLSSEDSAGFVPYCEILLRIARERQRLRMVELSTASVILLDRFTVSAASRALIDDVYDTNIENLLSDLAEAAGLRATIFCECPFDVSWERVQRRQEVGVALSPKELLGATYNSKLAAKLTEAFRIRPIDGRSFTAEKWSIDTSISELKSQEQLAKRLDSQLLQ